MSMGNAATGDAADTKPLPVLPLDIWALIWSHLPDGHLPLDWKPMCKAWYERWWLGRKVRLTKASDVRRIVNTPCTHLQLPGLASVQDVQLLTSMTRLRDLDLVAVQNLGELLDCLPPRLMRLSLAYTDVSMQSLPKLSQLVNLQHLNLNQTNINDNIVKVLPRSLRSLNMSNTSVTGHQWAALPPKLEALHVDRCPNVNLDHWVHLPRSVRTLHVGAAPDVSQEALSMLPALEELHVWGTALTDPLIAALPRTLLRLDAHDCDQLRLGSETVVKTLPPHLQRLDVSLCPVSDQSLTALPGSLRWLKLSRNQTGAGLTGSTFSLLPNGLYTLLLADCSNILTPHLKLLPRGLRELDLSGCHAVKSLVGLPPLVKWLNLKGCHAEVEHHVPWRQVIKY